MKHYRTSQGKSINERTTQFASENKTCLWSIVVLVLEAVYLNSPPPVLGYSSLDPLSRWSSLPTFAHCVKMISYTCIHYWTSKLSLLPRAFNTFQLWQFELESCCCQPTFFSSKYWLKEGQFKQKDRNRPVLKRTNGANNKFDYLQVK